MSTRFQYQDVSPFPPVKPLHQVEAEFAISAVRPDVSVLDLLGL